MDIDLDALVAIDVHTHAEISQDGSSSLGPELLGASEKYFKAHGHRQPTVDARRGVPAARARRAR